MSQKTIWVYRGASEASEILDTPENLAAWAQEGYFPKAVNVTAAEATKAEAAGTTVVQTGGEPVEGVTQAPETTTANSAEQLPEGSQASDTGSTEPSTPPDAAGQDAGAPAAEATQPEDPSEKG